SYSRARGPTTPRRTDPGHGTDRAEVRPGSSQGSPLASVGRGRAVTRGQHLLPQGARGLPVLELFACDLDVRRTAAVLRGVGLDDVPHPWLVRAVLDVALYRFGGTGLLGVGPQLLVAETL